MARAKKLAVLDEQLELFTALWAPNIDVHLHSATEAIAQISGKEPERAQLWLSGVVGSLRPLKTRRFAFPASRLDRLLHVMPPAVVNLDAASAAVARAIWAHTLGLKPLHVRRERQRLLADSPRWPRGFRVKDAPWTAIATVVNLGYPLDIDENAKVLLRRKLEDAGTKIGVAGLAGSAVVIETRRPEMVEAMGLPGLAYCGDRNSGTYKMPLLAAEPLLRQQVIDIPPELRKAIQKATAPVRPLRKKDFSPTFPYTLYDFQAQDAARAIRILETTGGVLLAGDMGSGKGNPVTEVVLTPTGTRLVGDIEVGDFLVGRDGKPTGVLGVFPQGVQQLYRVSFTDKTSVVVDGDHLWAVHSAVMKDRGRAGKVLSTRALREGPLRDGAGNLRWYIPICDPVQFETAAPLPIDPYLLGVLLGDGSVVTATVRLTSDDPYIVAAAAAVLPDGATLVCAPFTPHNRVKRAAERGCAPEGVRDQNFRVVGGRELVRRLRELGVFGKRAWEKSVPSSYLVASELDRRSLLQGLLDTDGGLPYADRSSSSVEFTSTSEQLVDDVTWLVQSLGGTARKSAPRRTSYPYKGEKRLGRPSWRLSVQLPKGVAPFRLPRKADGYRERVKYQPTRGILSIEPEGREHTVCFKVDAADELFLLRNFTTTHNTTVSLGLADYLDIWPLLIVAPLTAFSTWQRQLAEVGKSAYLATESSAKVWARIEAGDLDAVVISYDRLPAFVELIERMHFRGIVADEIQRIRNPGSKRSRALRALASAVPLRIGLSGTPLTNTVADLLPVGAFLAPGEWRPRANEKDLDDMYPGDPTESIADHLGSLMVRRRIDETGAPMPKRNDHRVYVELTPEQRRALEDLETEAQAAKEAGEFDDPKGRFHAFAKLQKQRQIINAPGAAGLAGPNPKVVAAIKLAKDFLAQGRKGVIFCADRATFTELGQTLDGEGIGWVGIWGSTPPAHRIGNEKKFHAGAPAPNGHPTSVVLCTIQAGSEAWSATPTATWLIATAYMYAPATLAQMEARVHRLNSDLHGPDIEICYMHAQVPGGSLDDRMLEILEVKKALFAQVVDRRAHQDTTSVHYSMGDLVFLLTGKRDTVADKAHKDAKAATGREQAKKAHAKSTLYRRKKGNADLAADSGEQALTLAQYRALDELLEAADTDDDGYAADAGQLEADYERDSFDASDDED